MRKLSIMMFLLGLCGFVYAQNIQIKGTVTSATDSYPIIGASVVDKTDKTNGTITDIDGNGIINEKDQQWIFDPTPAFSYGINIYLEYKNFDLTMFWQGVQGVDIISDLKKETDLWSGLNIGFLNKGKRVLDAWSPANPGSDIPALARNDSNNEKRVSTYYVETGSFLKLRNLQVGYNVPKAWAEKIRMERLRLYLSAQNLLTIKSKDFTGVDPENVNYGYPIPLNITFGVNVSF